MYDLSLKMYEFWMEPVRLGRPWKKMTRCGCTWKRWLVYLLPVIPSEWRSDLPADMIRCCRD